MSEGAAARAGDGVGTSPAAPMGPFRRYAWIAFLALEAVLIGVFLALPAGSPAEAVVFVAATLLAVPAIALGIALNRPRPSWPWAMMLGAQAAYALLSVVWRWYPELAEKDWEYPSVLDAVYWLIYIAWGAFLVVASYRRSRKWLARGLETSILLVAVLTLAWVLVIEPMSLEDLEPDAALATVTYPVLLVGVACLAAAVAISPGLGQTGALITLWAAFELGADMIYIGASAQGTVTGFEAQWLALWMASPAFLGAAALNPGMASLLAMAPERQETAPMRFLLASAVAICVPVLGLLVLHEEMEFVGHAVLAGVFVLILALVLARVRTLGATLRLERELRAELSESRAEASAAALRDPLTGLANRGRFDPALKTMLESPARPGHTHAVVVADIDALKTLNDTHGHTVGDEVLRVVAQRFSGFADGSRLVARIGGDEFAMLLPDIDVRTALAIGRTIHEATVAEANIGTLTLSPSASVGVYLGEAGDSADDALTKADVAMYSAKRSGRGAEVFEPDRHSAILERNATEAELRGVSARSELVLHYQPVVDLATRRVVSVEALVRWQHPRRGFLGPGAFIGIAEESGAIASIGGWVLHQACFDARAWQALADGAGIGVAVNASRREFASGQVAARVEEALSTTGLRSSLLTLEVTESAFAEESSGIRESLRHLRSLGVSVALDDFGTGYSTMAQLKSQPLDVIKLDKSLVDGIAENEEDWAVASAIMKLAMTLELKTLAEGIETGAELATLRSLGCELGQGFLFAKPMPLDDLLRVFEAQSRGKTLPLG